MSTTTAVEAEQQRIGELSGAAVTTPRWLICRYAAPAIIVGRSQRLDPDQLARAARQQLPLVRRKSGGGAVMAGPEMLSLSVFLPHQHPISRANAVVAYNWLGDVWREVLAEHHIESRICAVGEARQSQQQARDAGADWACYSSVSHGELLTMDGRKLLGIAQIRNRYCTVLTSGIYLYPTDWSTLAAVVTGGLAQVEFLKKYNASIDCVAGAAAAETIRAIPARIHANLCDQLAGVDVRPTDNERGGNYEA